MITFENGALTTDATLSVTDSQAIFQFADYCVQTEKERIIKLLESDGLNCDCDWCQINGDVPSQHHWRILALIKGEK